MPEELEPIEKPACLDYLWQWFCELSNSRQYTDFGPLALSYQEIQAWANLTGKDPAAWEVEAIKQIDRLFLNEATKK
jgi:hypothetical protein